MPEHPTSHLRALADAASAHDGQPPFSDQSLVDAATGDRAVILWGADGHPLGVAASEHPAAAAILSRELPFEAEFVVAPAERHRGLGRRLLAELIDASRSSSSGGNSSNNNGSDNDEDDGSGSGNNNGSLTVWAHGDHADARHLATAFSLVPTRELLQLRLSPVAAAGTPARVTAFRPGIDDAEWLRLNALAFADHPEQGSLEQPDLDARLAESWFDPDDFLIARADDGSMTGFCWLKVDPAFDSRSEPDSRSKSDSRLKSESESEPEARSESEAQGAPHRVGEFYAVGVSPAAQGTGLGRALVTAGLRRLEARGIRTASLYVEAENTRAVSLYRSVGFSDFTIDVQYSTVAEPARPAPALP